MLLYWIWFAQLPKVSEGQKRMLLQYFRDPEELYHVADDSLHQVPEMTDTLAEALGNRSLTQAEGILRECVDKGIRVLTLADPAYPAKLKNIFDPPLVLYCRGQLPDWKGAPAIGVVGTRKATPYGLRAAYRFGGQIAVCGGTLISGGAAGIDTMALKGAMAAGKPVVAVLGCGVDVAYPAKNRALLEEIAKSGCILSEYPPRSEPLAWHFPQRNRIISGMSDAVLVVEAPLSSGALITARQAMEQGRDVYVIPGNVDEAACAGSNALLRDFGIAALSGWDILRQYQASYPRVVMQADFTESAPQQETEPVRSLPKQQPDKKSIDKLEKSTYSVVNNSAAPLNEQERVVFRELGREPVTVDTVIEKVGLPAGTVKSILTKLTVRGYACNHPGGRISRKS